MSHSVGTTAQSSMAGIVTNVMKASATADTVMRVSGFGETKVRYRSETTAMITVMLPAAMGT